MSDDVKAKSDGDAQRESQSKQLLALTNELRLFHTPQKEAYAVLKVNGHTEVWPLRSKDFKTWLTGQYYAAAQRAPNNQATLDAIGTLEAKARFKSPEEEVYLRVAPIAGKVYVDLGNDAWEVVEVTDEGWKVLSESPIRFRRPNSMRSLPRPERGGALDDLRPFLNIGSEEDWKLLVAFMVASLKGLGPFPILILQGEQGSAKSTTARVIRSLIDPSAAELRATPKDERDLVITAKQSWLMAFDNLSGVQPWLSDALCRLSTGSGFSTRALYSDSDEVIFDAKRPLVVNGIDDMASRDDLKDRTIALFLPSLSPEQRRDEQGFWKDFNNARARILGALLDAVSGVLRFLPDVDIQGLPRMADFARTGAALESARNWPQGSFSAAYDNNRASASEQSLEHPVAVALLECFGNKSLMEWTATEWLRALGPFAEDSIRRAHSWPKDPKALSNLLRRLAPAFRAQGIEIRWTRQGHTRSRIIAVERIGKVASPSSAASACATGVRS